MTYMIFIYIFIYMVLFIANSYMYNKRINVNNVIITIWTITSILSMFGFYDMYVPNEKTYIYILLFMVTFELCSLFFLKTIKIKEQSDDMSKTLNYNIINIVLIILICVMAYFTLQGIEILIEGGSFSEVRDAYLNHENFSNKLKMFISLVILPIGHAIGVYTIIEYVNKKKITATLILFLIFLCELIIYTGGRAAIVHVAVLLVVALMDKYNNNIIKIIKENKLIILTLIIIGIIIGIITLQRNLRGKGIIYNMYCYFVGSIHLLGVYVDNPEKFLLTNDYLLYGQVLISGFSYPILFVLQLVGINIKAGLYILYETTQRFIQISPNTTINNNVTMIYYALRDFGVFGIFIYTSIINFVFTYLYKKRKKNESILYKALYYYFIRCVIFLLFDFQFANTGVIFTFFYLILIYKLCTNRNTQKNSELNRSTVSKNYERKKI